MDDYIHFYNNKRPHGSLNNQTPEKFNQLASEAKIPNMEISL
ncbi:hypothetical protein DTX80_05300 [Bacilli bacterium]|nr:hypothetical protein DTX80_05300 [Bacilli bacterium]